MSDVIILNGLLHKSAYESLSAAGLTYRVLDAYPFADLSQPVFSDARILIPKAPGRATAEMMDLMPKLRVITTVGVGHEQIDIPAATERGIVVVNQAGVGKEPVAEHSVALMLSLSRRIPQTHELLRARRGDWQVHDDYLESVSDTFSTLLIGKTVGVVGLGHIGTRVAEICRRGFDMNVAVFSPSAQDSQLASVDAVRCHDLMSLCMTADYVVMTSLARNDGKPTMERKHIAAMKRTAFFVNVARGSVVDQRALYEALVARKIAGAGLDVFDREPPGDDPIMHLDNVVLSPHCAGISDGVSSDLAHSMLGQALSVLAGERPPHMLNPEVWNRRRR